MTKSTDKELTVSKRNSGKELFRLVERDQGYAFISDAIDELPNARVLDIARGSLKHTEATAAKLKRFIAKYETKLERGDKGGETVSHDTQVKQEAPQMDWRQVELNGGPPCFFIEDGKYCGRAKRWQGHGVKTFHDFVSLDDLLATVRREEREAGGFNLSADDVKDLHEILTNAADDLDTEGLGDTDSCIFARRWAKRLEEYRPKKGGK